MWDEAAKAFKFKLGELVVHASNPESATMCIIERVLGECHGGIQRNYLCSIPMVERGPRREMFNESELAAFKTNQDNALTHLEQAKECLVTDGCFDAAADVRAVQQKLKSTKPTLSAP